MHLKIAIAIKSLNQFYLQSIAIELCISANCLEIIRSASCYIQASHMINCMLHAHWTYKIICECAVRCATHVSAAVQISILKSLTTSQDKCLVARKTQLKKWKSLHFHAIKMLISGGCTRKNCLSSVIFHVYRLKCNRWCEENAAPQLNWTLFIFNKAAHFSNNLKLNS